MTENKGKADTWNPKQYLKFEKERSLPFHDLMKLVSVQNQMTVVDLGCGTGHLTKELHEYLKAKSTLGIDSSSAMLEDSPALTQSNLSFQVMAIDDFIPSEKYDLIFSNATLHWLPNHAELFKRLSQYLTESGQIAIQMPANQDYPTHMIAKEIANESPFKEQMGDNKVLSLMKIEEYSQLLYQLGFKNQMVRMQVYPHILESTDSVVEWVKGSLLTFYQSHLTAENYNLFITRYQEKIKAAFKDQKPFFLPFKRILIWGQR